MTSCLLFLHTQWLLKEVGSKLNPFFRVDLFQMGKNSSDRVASPESVSIPFNDQGPVVQSIVSLTSSGMVKILTVLVITIPKFTGIAAEKILAYMPYLMIKVLTIH